MKNLSLKAKLFMAMTMFVLVFAVVIVLFIELYLKNVLLKESIEDAKVVAATMANHIVDPLLISDFVSIDGYFEEMMKANPEIAYIFIEKNGTILLHTFKEGFPRGLLNLGHKQNTIDHVTVKADPNIYLDISAPVHSGQGGTLRVGIDERMGEEAIRNALKTIAVVTALLLAVAFAIAIVIARRLTAPLTLLTVSASEIAAGNYSGSVPAMGYDEIGKLALAFSTMLQAVRLREDELKSLNTELETVNVSLHEYILRLNEVSEELIRAKQNAAVKDTGRTFLHHLRQPLTYLIMALELLSDDLAEGKPLSRASVGNQIAAVKDAGERLAELLKKFEGLHGYKVIDFDGMTTIVDIENQGK
ncbi:MAG: HAMP domain-containing protein [Nitrospirae bacterium]|nr:HAMP domain-containing protein [Nitrospirota bacterium]